jgi:hypothetical protein
MSIPKPLMDMPKKNSRIYSSILFLSIVILALAGYWNWYRPSANYWPLLVSDILTVIPAVGAAVAATHLLRQFGPGERPRPIWFWFTLAWWAWVLGEFCSLAYDGFKIPYGELSFVDLFWTAGYFCFGLSLFYQYRNIYSTQKKSPFINYLPFIALTLAATFGFTQWALAARLGVGISWFALFLAVFYPVCDLVIGVIALWLAFIFGKGTWGRPWWGLIVFGIADGINIFLWIGGNNMVGSRLASFLDSLSSTIYNCGYIIAMLGFFLILLSNFWTALPKDKTLPLR